MCRDAEVHAVSFGLLAFGTPEEPLDFKFTQKGKTQITRRNYTQGLRMAATYESCALL